MPCSHYKEHRKDCGDALSGSVPTLTLRCARWWRDRYEETYGFKGVGLMLLALVCFVSALRRNRGVTLRTCVVLHHDASP